VLKINDVIGRGFAGSDELHVKTPIIGVDIEIALCASMQWLDRDGLIQILDFKCRLIAHDDAVRALRYLNNGRNSDCRSDGDDLIGLNFNFSDSSRGEARKGKSHE